MADYYREPAPFPSVPSGQQLYGAVVRNVNDDPDDPADAGEFAEQSRQCSVRGCGAPLPAGYTHKMCETCRGRHRTYASTKRAKRKMEKAALGLGSQLGQVVWMPPDDAIQNGGQSSKDTAAASTSHRGPRPVPEPLAPVPNDSSTFEYHPQPLDWDPGVIDPALMPPGSEQAFIPEGSDSAGIPQGSESPLPHGLLPTQISQEYELSRALDPLSSNRSHHHWQQDGLQHYPRTTAGDETGVNSNGTPGPSGIPPSIDNGSVPPRYCSIKGCRALVSGSSFFKMCEPCRDRYRSYGTTKRAKWRREKEVVVAELQKIRDEEDRHRAEQGLPPLDRSTPTEWREWHAEGTPQTPPGFELTPTPNAPLAPRMCTVSHCREILPGGYQYLRCERHRIQNRHHSKLKRVRDKEVKAQAFDGWAAAAAMNARGMSEFSREGSAEASALDTSMEHEDRDVDGEDYDVGGHEYSGSPNESASVNGNAIAGPSSSLVGVDTPFGEPSSGVPPAARGTRRTNHVCSIKSCYNLLAPTNPWKMCDQCRERDRKVRREKALRDSGIITTPPPRAPRVPKALKPPKDKDGGPGAEGAPKKKKKKKKQVEVVSVEQPEAVASGSGSTTFEQDVPNSNPTPPPVSSNGVTADANASAADIEPTAVAAEPQPALIFMNPLLPDSNPDPATLASPVPSNVQGPAALEENAAPSTVADHFHVVSVEQIVSRGAQSAAAAPGSKRAARRKKTQPASNRIPSNPATVESSSHPSSSPAVNAPDPSTATPPTVQPLEGNASGSPPAPAVPPPAPITPTPAMAEAPPPPGMTPMPPYMPYYMSSYGMAPYGSQITPYPYGAYTYSRPPYGPAPIYQPPYSPYGQPYAYSQPYAQPYGPPSSAQPMYSVSSDFLSRADYAAASQSTQHGQASYASPGGAPGSSYYTTFSARTGEPHVRSTPTPFTARRKRQLDQGSEASTSGTSKRQTTAVEQSPDTNTSAPVVATSSVEASSANETDTPTQADPSSSANESHEVQSSPQATCSNKTCHRTLPVNSSGTLCARCKERFKKRQVKAKQRFRLEPRKLLLGRQVNDISPPQSTSSGNEGLVTATA